MLDFKGGGQHGRLAKVPIIAISDGRRRVLLRYKLCVAQAQEINCYAPTFQNAYSARFN